MKKHVYLIGAGGHARSLTNLVQLNDIEILGLYEEKYEDGETVHGNPIVGKPDDIKEDQMLVLAVGDNKRRASIYEEYHGQIYQEALIHPKATVENRVAMGTANQIFAHAFINADVKMGDDNIINSGCIVEHESQIGSHNHIAVGATVCGRVIIGDRCLIGAGATIIPSCRICDDVTIGAGAVVVKDITEPGMYVGSPARKIK